MPLDWVLVILHRGKVLIKLVNGAVGAGAVAAFLDLGSQVIRGTASRSLPIMQPYFL